MKIYQKKLLDPKEIRSFQKKILDFYKNQGRHDLPWRHTRDPYKILISEMMLQQTQVSRVQGKYKEFLHAFPTLKKLAGASLFDILHIWQGMGYNRRARYLHDTAHSILRDHKGIIPTNEQTLRTFPGVGEYTANAILTFARNETQVFIETNIRRTFIYYFFPNQSGVGDRHLFPLIKQTLYVKDPRTWYYALMDYGAQLPKIIKENPNIKSAHYTKQTTFKNSVRELRGKILRILILGPHTFNKISSLCDNDVRITYTLNMLIKDKLIKNEGRGVYIIQ